MFCWEKGTQDDVRDMESPPGEGMGRKMPSVAKLLA